MDINQAIKEAAEVFITEQSGTSQGSLNNSVIEALKLYVTDKGGTPATSSINDLVNQATAYYFTEQSVSPAPRGNDAIFKATELYLTAKSEYVPKSFNERLLASAGYFITNGSDSLAFQGLVANRVRFNNAVSTSMKQFKSRSRHTTTTAVTELTLAFQNFYIDASTGRERGQAATAKLTASVEYPSGTYTQVTFEVADRASAGVPERALLPAVPSNATTEVGLVFSSPCAVTIPANTDFWVRMFYDNDSGVPSTGCTYVNGFRDPTASTGDSLQLGASGLTDSTMGGTISHNASAAYCCPAAIIGLTDQASAYLVGDSIMWGQANLTLDTVYSRIGLVAPGLPTTLPFLNGASPSFKSSEWLSWSPSRKLLFPYVTTMYNNLGINDTTGATAADIANYNTLIAAEFPSRVKKYLCTLTPRVITSSDGYTTIAGQTIHGSTTTLYQPYNALVRAGVSGYTDYIEMTHGVTEASPTDSGKLVLSPNNRIVTDAVSNATTTITSATMAFTSADIGYGVRMFGAGVAGANLNGMINSVTNSTTALLASTTSTAVNPMTMNFGSISHDGLHFLNAGASLTGAAVPASTYAYP